MSERVKKMIELVKAEAAAIKEFAKPSERERLSFFSMDANHTDRCIYGQMTGNCYSERALELILKCAPNVYTATPSTGLALCPLNGAPYSVEPLERCSKFHTPIEVFILQDPNYLYRNENNKRLVDYLRGDSDVLELEEFEEDKEDRI